MQAYAAGDNSRRHSDDMADDKPPSQWGLRPEQTAGNGIQQEAPKFLYWVRKLMALYLPLLADTGELDMLQKAADWLHQKGLTWAEQDCLIDLARYSRQRS